MPAAPTTSQWLRIEDFSPGCFSNGGVVTGNTGHRQLSAPIGAADAENTWSCWANPSRALVALPGVTQTYTWPTDYKNPGTTYIVGLLIHDELGNGQTEAVIMSEYHSGSNNYWQGCSYILESAVTNSITNQTYSNAAGGIFGSPYPQMTRTSGTVSGGFAQPPFLPTIVFPGPASATTSGSLWLYPDPSNPTSFTAKNLIGTTGAPTGQLVTYANRIVTFSGTNYAWPGSVGGFNTNENLFYTDPPQSTVWPAAGSAPTVLASEAPYGYGATGSVSTGELFVVKKRGGGLILNGDVANGTVTVLPGVASTGNIYGQGASTSAGFVYCSYEAGCWSWNGSNTSQKLSAQLDDGFFLPPEFSTMLSNNYGFYVTAFRSKVYVSNNWMMDTNNGSWWTYYPRKAQGGSDLYYTQVVNGDYIYASKLSFTNTDRNWLYRFDNATPAQTYQWQSLPLHLAPVDQVVDVREIIVRASATNPNATVTVSIIDDGQVVAGPFTQSGTISTGPELIRFNFGAISCYEPSVRIVVKNDPQTPGDMPVIHGIDMRYVVSNHLPSVN